MATIAPSCSALIKCILGSSTKASKNGAAPEEGLKKIWSTPEASSCATSSAPPFPFTFRDADGGFAAPSSAAAGRNGASDCAIEFAAAAVIPSVPKPESSSRREIRLSRYCLIKCFMASLLSSRESHGHQELSRVNKVALPGPINPKCQV